MAIDILPDFITLAPNSGSQVSRIGRDESSVDKGGSLGASIIVRTERLPQNAVAEVVINESARKFVPEEYQEIFDKDFLLSLARLTIPWLPEEKLINRLKRLGLKGAFPVDSNKRDLLALSCQGREVNVAYGSVPYGDGLNGSRLAIKGVLPSGYFYQCSDLMSLGINSTKDPIGLLGCREAKRELEISNAMLSFGVRSSLVVGYLALRPDQLEKFIARYWERGEYKSTGQALVEVIKKIKDNNDTPAMLFRLGGEGIRLEMIGEDIEIRQPAFDQMRRAGFARAARVFSKELNTNPVVSDIVGELGIIREQIREILDRVGKYQVLDRDQSLLYVRYIASIFFRDTQLRLDCVGTNPAFKDASVMLSPGKDCGLDLIAYDFEPGRDRQSEGSESYIPDVWDKAIEYIEKYVFLMAKARLLTPLIADTSGGDRIREFTGRYRISKLHGQDVIKSAVNLANMVINYISS